MADEEIIAEMASRLVDGFHPERIILIGSRARGTAEPDSDVDLVVVVKSACDRWALGVEMHRAVSGLGLPKDIIVLTRAEFDVGAGVLSGVAHSAFHEGRVLYAA